MHQATLLPTPDAIPVSPVLLEIPLLLLFIFHLLLMNTVVGSCIIALFTPARSDTSRALLGKISHRTPTLLALTINLGVAPLLFLQALYGQFFFTGSVLIAPWWLAVVGILLIAYYGLYYHDLGFSGYTTGRKFVLAMSLILLLAVAFVFVNNMTLMLIPESWQAMASDPGSHFLNLAEPSVIPRFFHFMTAAVAVGGLAIALFCRRKAGDDDQARAMVARGLNWFAGATLLQLAFGTWFLLSLPEHISDLLLGGSPSHTGTFAFALAMAATAVVLALKRRVWPTAIFLVLSVAGMAMVRDLVRKAFLAPLFTLDDLPVAGDSSSFIAFVLSLAFGILCIIYLIRLYRRSLRQGAKGV